MTLTKLKFPAAVVGVVAVAVGAVFAWQVPPPPPGAADPQPKVQAVNATPAGVVKPLLTLSGPDSRVAAQEYTRVTGAEEWKKTWLRHHGIDPKDEWTAKVPMLDVDFTRCEVIVLFRGSSANSRGVWVESITETADAVTIRFADASYQTVGGAVKVTPYGFLLVPKSDKLVVIERDARRLIREPSVWKEEARLKRPDPKPAPDRKP